MEKKLGKNRQEESQINLEIEERKLKKLLEKIRNNEGAKVSVSKSETHFKDKPSDSFSLRFNDRVSLEESDGKTKVMWTKDESFPALKRNRQTEIVVIIGEYIEKVMMKFNFKDKNVVEPYVFHDAPKLNWWIIINLLNRTIDDRINT